MKSNLRAIIELEVLSAYEEKGIENIFRILKDEDTVRKTAKEKQGKDYNEREFQIARLVCKLDIISAAMTMKKVCETEDDLHYLANQLIELGNELREVK